MHVIDLTGQTFGRLTVLGRAPRGHRVNEQAAWDCLCECGNRIVAVSQSLRHGHGRSCGCLRKDVRSALSATHRETESREYRTWCHAKGRCYNPTDHKYANYGGRGITMCAAWKASFEAFLADMGRCPVGCSLDRIDNDGHYEPGNCRWADATTQANNRRPRKKQAA